MPLPHAISALPADVVAQLQAAGLRATRPRLLVLRAFQERAAQHLSAEAIVLALRAQATPLPRASVYNSISALVAHGLLMVTDVGPGRTLYEYMAHWHHHFICQQCGVILDVPCVVGASPCLLPDQIDAEVSSAQVIFRGLCRACVLANTSAAPLSQP
ncbi:MAG: transcriptional repressor [Ktedonobacterales bacterium]|nr:transcriptional repressor [Ktedonobacterales bacterium]